MGRLVYPFSTAIWARCAKGSLGAGAAGAPPFFAAGGPGPPPGCGRAGRRGPGCRPGRR